MQFDQQTAKHYLKNVAGSPHAAYKDAQGNVCLWCVSKSSYGGVAVNEAGLNWLRQQQGGKFIRLTNSEKKFDKLVDLVEFPEKEMRDGGKGRYAFYDPQDFEVAMAFTPIEVPF